MRLAKETVTCYLQQPDETYARQVVEDVSWFDRSIATVSDKTLEIAGMVSIRIPVGNAPEGFQIRPDDMVVKGICEAEIGVDTTTSKLKYQHGGVTVKAVHDNRRGRCPHWKVEAV